MPIYIPDKTGTMRKVNKVSIMTPDGIRRECKEMWDTNNDGISRLIYRNKVYLYKYGYWNVKLVGSWVSFGGEDSDFGKVEMRDNYIYMDARRWSSHSDGAYRYINLWNGPSGASKDGGYSLLKYYNRVCFDIVTTGGTSSIPYYAWFGLKPSWNGARGRGIEKKDFSGIVMLSLSNLKLEDCAPATGMWGLGFGVFTKERESYTTLKINQIWLE